MSPTALWRWAGHCSEGSLSTAIAWFHVSRTIRFAIGRKVRSKLKSREGTDGAVSEAGEVLKNSECKEAQ
eukprot:6342843-Alexandrium_andersonii.AAC.1